MPRREGWSPRRRHRGRWPALVTVTEWLIYRNPDFDRLISLMRRALIVDGRNLYDPARMKALGIEHHGLGRRAP